jgi:large subunit ribosomal protein L17
MRHRKSGRKLGRTASHRRATLGALSTALLRHKRITTTIARAKETRMLVEKLITRARKAAAAADAPAAGIHARRIVARLIHDKAVVKELFTTIAEKVGSRPGGYTRIVRLGQRPGDGAELAVIELVDFAAAGEAPAAAPAEEKKPAPRRTRKAAEKTETTAAAAGGEKKKGRKKPEKPA